MNRDRYVRGVASGSALVGPSILDEAGLGIAAFYRIGASGPVGKCGAVTSPASSPAST
jgi:hypothetical protein